MNTNSISTPRAYPKSLLFVYWIATVLVVFSMITGGVTEVMQVKQAVDGMRILGYPDYFMVILGVWKLAGGVTLCVPGFTRVKEWAYAGIFFDATGATVSHLACKDYGPGYFHIITTVILAILTVVSWASRPPNRVLGNLFNRSSVA